MDLMVEALKCKSDSIPGVLTTFHYSPLPPCLVKPTFFSRSHVLCELAPSPIPVLHWRNPWKNGTTSYPHDFARALPSGKLSFILQHPTGQNNPSSPILLAHTSTLQCCFQLSPLLGCGFLEVQRQQLVYLLAQKFSLSIGYPVPPTYRSNNVSTILPDTRASNLSLHPCIHSVAKSQWKPCHPTHVQF